MQTEATLDELINDVLSAEIGLLRKQLAQSESYAKALEKALDASIQKGLTAKKCGTMNCGTSTVVNRKEFILSGGEVVTLEWTKSPQGPQKITLCFPSGAWASAFPLIEGCLLMGEKVTRTWGREAILAPFGGTARVGSVLVPLNNDEMARWKYEQAIKFLVRLQSDLLELDHD